MTTFWGCVIQPGSKPTPYVPPPDGSRLHISQATLGGGARNGERVAVKIHTGEEDKTIVLLCALRAGVTDTTHLDIVLHEYAEFTLEGDTPVHLCGNYMPEMDFGSRFGLGDDDDDNEGEDEEEDDDDDMLRQWMLPYGAEDEEDDEDYDEDEEGDDLDDDSDEEPRPMLRKATKKGGVVIQELDDDEDEEDEEMEERGQAPHSAGKTKPGVHEADYIPLGGAAAAAASAGKKRPAQDSQAAPPQKKATAGSTPPASQKSRPESKQQEAPASGAKPGSHFNDGPPGSLGSRKFTNGLEVINLVNGKPDGKVALPGKRVSMKYVGRLKANGKVFDATKGAPFSFRLGVGEVIKGWDIGVKNMRVGDKRRLIIPPDLGYGSKGAPGAIPPNAWLEFDVELVGVH